MNAPDKKVTVRQHKGTLKESNATTVTVADRWELWELILASAPLPPMLIRAGPSALQITPYGPDKIMGRDAYLITVPGYGVWGMSDGDLP